MNKSLKLFGLSGLLILAQVCYGQSKKEQALAKAKEAIILEDEEGKYDEAIKLFEAAIELDPENLDYPYELAYAYSGKKEYKKASKILEPLLKHKDADAKIYHALGNAYDYQGKPGKAIEIYENGIEKFPNSGELFLELGNMQTAKKDYLNALTYYEKGIEKDPGFPSNYYWASKILCNSDAEVWGMLYGEIFINLERNTKRTAEISQLLFDTYKSQIQFTSDTSYSVSFSKNATLEINDLIDHKKLKLPFEMGCYEMLLMIAVFGDNQIDINSLDRIRDRFITSYFQNDHAKNYPNILFDFNKKIQIAGHFESYNHWLLMKGDEDEFAKWHNNNKAKWDDFVKWYTDNRIQVDLTHRFYRGQYSE